MIDKIRAFFGLTEDIQTPHLLVDIHAHLVPGVDDGCKTLSESLKIIRRMRENGFKKLILTPHVMRHRYPNTITKLKTQFSHLRLATKYNGINIKLELSAEYYLDKNLINYINKKEILCFHKNFLLFEMSYTVLPINLESVIFEMISSGYKPVLAHPERYSFFQTKLFRYKELKKLGVLFQVNLNSFSGYYGKNAKKTATYLMNEGMIDLLGSDIHNEKHLEHFTKNINSALMDKIYNNNKIINTSLL